MENKPLQTEPFFHSKLSFRPLIEKWQQKTDEGRKGASFFYKDILQRVSKFPELLEPIEDIAVLKEHPALLEVIMSTIFPVTSSDNKELYAVSVPFTYDYIYTSSLFRLAFLDENGKMRIKPEDIIANNITNEKIEAAYRMILHKFYGFDFAGPTYTIQPYNDPSTGLTRYLELRIDPQFIDVHQKQELPVHDFGEAKHKTTAVLKIPHLQQLLPLDMFEFEGIAIVHIYDVTEREVINEIKNELLNIHSFVDADVFNRLQMQMQNLLGLPDVKIGLTPFFKVNEHHIFAEQYYRNSILLKFNKTAEGQAWLYGEMNKFCKDEMQYMVFPELTKEVVQDHPYLQCGLDMGAKSLILTPLRSKGELIGVLVFISDKPGHLNQHHFSKIEPALPLFILALEKSAEILDNEVDKVIKQQFTAVQSSVEWKFTESALEYINKKQKGEDAKIGNIVFENVFPLYGAIDVRNSSTERNQAIQQDLLEQLTTAGTIVKKAQQQTSFPLLQEISYRIEKYIYTVSNALFSGDEITIHNFLKGEIVQLFRHLKQLDAGVGDDIEKYFGSLDTHVDMLYHHRKEFEESITLINNRLAKFIDEEQLLAQQIYPHYFERFVTDGVDFNIYIGQSITPAQAFDQFYLKNLKMWQLTTLTKAAQMTYQLEKQLSLSLHTTQLILAHANPISISFRIDERKFDVDGAYNIRYEIIKKRIDKVRIENTNERLTQPGKLAIVYSQPNEAREYAEYIEFLQNQGLLSGEVEHYDLEELQGVSGLKALRVGINLNDTAKVEKKEEQGKATLS
jgi:hypothetical protein